MKGGNDGALKTVTASGVTISNRETGTRARVKRKTKELLHIESSSDEGENVHNAALKDLKDSPAFNTSKFVKRASIGTSGISSKAIDQAKDIVGAIIHPKAAIKSGATKKTASILAKSRPYLSRKADLAFLEAHDDLERAEASQNGSDDEETAARKKDRIDQCEDCIEEMERARQNMRVAWVTARHVQRVRVVDVIPNLPFPEHSFFEREDDCGFPEYDWGKWIAYKLLHKSRQFSAQYIDDFEHLPFDLGTLRKHVERLIIVSAPLQSLALEVRCIYRWEDPWRTGRFMALYFLLWYISHIMTFFYGFILYSTMMNFYYPQSLEALRQGIERTMDRGATAIRIGEMMDKHGSDDWLGPLMEELGPFVQLQIVDLASFLETAYNFYHFRSPPATFATLFFFASLFLISALTDSRFAMKVFWFIIGSAFFVCWPVSSVYPRYRLLVSPFKWILWDVPNHPEWCFQYLQQRAAIVKEAILNHDSDDGYEECDTDSFHSAQSTLSPEPRDILSFRCTYSNVPGRFIISTHGIRFTASTIAKSLLRESFNVSYADLVEMSKRQTPSSILSPLAKVTTGMDKLELRFRRNEGGAGMHAMGELEEAEIVTLENMKGRDNAFNAVIAFGGVRWQHLQQRSRKLKPEEKKGDSLTDK